MTTMMALLVLLLGVATSTLAAPPVVVKYESVNDGLGTYKFEYELSDGTYRREEGFLKNADDPEKAVVVVSGSYSYIGPDGVTYAVTYISDENGYQPQGAHIPSGGPTLQTLPPDHATPATPPPPMAVFLPPAVVASLLG